MVSIVINLPRKRCTWWLRPCTKGTSFDTPPPPPPPPPAENEGEAPLQPALSSEAAPCSDDEVSDERDL